MNDGISNLEFISYRDRLARLGGQLHRTHPLDGPQRLFVIQAGEVLEVTADRVATVIAGMEASTAAAITGAYGKGGAA